MNAMVALICLRHHAMTCSWPATVHAKDVSPRAHERRRPDTATCDRHQDQSAERFPWGSGLAVRRGQATEGTPSPADRRVLQWFEWFMPQGHGMPTAREGNIAEVFRAPAVERHIVDLGPSMLRGGVQDIDRVHARLENRVLD